MKLNRPFVAPFLKKYDDYLLKNHPDNWSFRTHFVVYYSVLFMLVLGLACYFTPYDLRDSNNTEFWVAAVGVLCGLGLIIWLIYLLRFNVFKRFGKVNTNWYSLKSFLHYSLSILFLSLPVFVPDVIETFRAKQKYTLTELNKDIFTTNQILCAIHKKDLKEDWAVMHVTLIADKFDSSFYSYSTNYKNEVDTQINYFPKLIREDENGALLSYQNEYNLFKGFYDSVKLKFDSIVIISENKQDFFINPGYEFLDSDPYYDEHYYNDGDQLNLSLKSNVDSILFRTIIQNNSTNGNLNKIKLQKLFSKYLTKKDSIDIVNEKFDQKHNQSNADPNTIFRNGTYEFENDKFIDYNYPEIKQMSYNIENISNKLSWYDSDDIEEMVIGMFMFIFSLALFLYIFRSSSIKIFFLSILSGVLMAIFLSFCGGFFRYSDGSLFGLTYFYYIVTFIIALQILRSKTKSSWHGIALNLITAFTPFLPIIFWGNYFSVLEHDPNISESSYQFIHEWGVYIAFYFGIVLIILLLPTLFAKLYRKWHSLPEE